MKTIPIILLLLCSTVQAHITNPDDYLKFVQTNGFWAMTQDSNKLIFCFGIDHNNKPACTTVPKQYIVIELPKEVQ